MEGPSVCVARVSEDRIVLIFDEFSPQPCNTNLALPAHFLSEAMVLPPQNHLAWKSASLFLLLALRLTRSSVSISFVHGFAFLWTTLRLHQRLKSRLWWDDAAILVAFIMDIFFLIQKWLKYKNHGGSLGHVPSSRS